MCYKEICKRRFNAVQKEGHLYPDGGSSFIISLMMNDDDDPPSHFVIQSSQPVLQYFYVCPQSLAPSEKSLTADSINMCQPKFQAVKCQVPGKSLTVEAFGP